MTATIVPPAAVLEPAAGEHPTRPVRFTASREQPCTGCDGVVQIGTRGGYLPGAKVCCETCCGGPDKTTLPALCGCTTRRDGFTRHGDRWVHAECGRPAYLTGDELERAETDAWAAGESSVLGDPEPAAVTALVPARSAEERAALAVEVARERGEPWITQPGAYDLSERSYHRDPVVGGSLSSTGARTILRAPALFRHEQLHGRPDSNAFDIGRAAHQVVLGEGAPLAVVDADDWRTKAAREARDAHRAAGRTPLLAAEHAAVMAMADAIRAHPVAGPLLARPGRSEASFVGRCPETGVMCRARFDRLPDVAQGERMIGVDVKTGRSADPAAFGRAMAEYGYHQQAAHYLDVLRWLDLADTDAVFVFVVVEKTAPHLVSVLALDAEAIEWGRVLNRKARDLYATCTASGVWPGYPVEPAVLSLPGWLTASYEAAHDRGDYRITTDLQGALT